MTLQDEIDALLAEAAPLRLLPDDEAEAKGLPELVDKINRLRAKQAREPFAESVASLEGAESVEAEPVKRGPGRPKKAD
jgi:hypothetical protein